MLPFVNPSNIDNVIYTCSRFATDAFVLYPCFESLLDCGFNFRSVLKKLLFSDERVVSFDNCLLCLFDFASLEVHAHYQIFVMRRDNGLSFALMTNC